MQALFWLTIAYRFGDEAVRLLASRTQASTTEVADTASFFAEP